MKVNGYCPMGCGETLMLDEDSNVICSYTQCPDPTRITQIACEPEVEHVVSIGNEGFALMHPLRERAGELFECEAHKYLLNLEEAPVVPGRYRMVPGTEPHHHPWVFTRIGDD